MDSLGGEKIASTGILIFFSQRRLKAYLIAVKAGASLPPIKQMFCGEAISAWKELEAVPTIPKKTVGFVVPFKSLVICIPEIDFKSRIWKGLNYLNDLYSDGNLK